MRVTKLFVTLLSTASTFALATPAEVRNIAIFQELNNTDTSSMTVAQFVATPTLIRLLAPSPRRSIVLWALF